MSNYLELDRSLKAKGIGCYVQGPDQLVVSDENPAMPSTNTFWVTHKNGHWYIGTWLPAVYLVPTDLKISDVCEIVFRSSPKAIYTIDNALAEQLKLRRLTEQEVDLLGFASTG